MTTFLRFFILALTPLLGVTLSVGPAFLFGLTSILLLTAVAALVHGLRPQIGAVGLLWAVLGLGVAVITVVDLLTTLLMPGIREAWGVYLNLLPFLPLVVLLPLERASAPTMGEDLSRALKTGLLLTLLFTAAALVRETLGRGSLTLVPDALTAPIPGLREWPIGILATGAGGFFLAALAVVGYRVLRPQLGGWTTLTDLWGPAQEPAADTPATPEVPAAGAPALEPIDQWGEDLAAVIGTGAGGEKRRLLVIGSGNGELAYYLAMLCLDGAKTVGGDAGFRVRGVDHFSTRIETAIRGVYREHQVDFIPAAVKAAWMTRGQGEDRFLWKVANEPRLHVQFEVADFQHGQVFFPQPAHVIVLNQGIEYVTDDKKAALLKTVCTNLVAGGALVVTGPFKRELLPEGMKRTGTSVFRKA